MPSLKHTLIIFEWKQVLSSWEGYCKDELYSFSNVFTNARINTTHPSCLHHFPLFSLGLCLTYLMTYFMETFFTSSKFCQILDDHIFRAYICSATLLPLIPAYLCVLLSACPFHFVFMWFLIFLTFTFIT